MEKLLPENLAEYLLRDYGDFLGQHEQTIKQHCYGFRKSKSIDKSYFPRVVEIDYNTAEDLALLQFQGIERPLSKVILTFANLGIEVQHLMKSAKVFQHKFLRIDEALQNRIGFRNVSSEDLLLHMSTDIDYFCKVNFFMQHTVTVVHNLFHQCGCFLHEFATEINLYDLFDYIADLLMQVLIFNELFANSNYRRYWAQYVNKIKNNSGSPLPHNTCELKGLQIALEEINYLMTEDILKFWFNNLNRLNNETPIAALIKLTAHTNEFISFKLKKLEQGKTSNKKNQHQLAHLNMFAILFNELLGQLDAKAVRNLLDLNGKYQQIWIYPKVHWLPAQFLLKQGKSLIRGNEKLVLTQVKQLKHSPQQNIEQMQWEALNSCQQITLLALKIQKMYFSDVFALKIEHFKKLSILLESGQKLAETLHSLILKTAGEFNLVPHTAQQATMLLLYQYYDLLDLIGYTFKSKVSALAKIINCLLQYMQFKLLQQLGNANKKIVNLKKHKAKIELLTALKFAEKCLQGPATSERLMTAWMALPINVFLSERIISHNQHASLQSILSLAQNLHCFQRYNDQINDEVSFDVRRCFLVFLQPYFLNRNEFNMFVERHSPFKLKDLLALTSLNESVLRWLTNESKSNICAKIELFLRLEGLSNMLVNPNKTFENEIDDYRSVVIAQPFPLNSSFIDLKSQVENYFSEMFYNLTTCASYDWATYESLRHLAAKHLQIVPVDDYLPNEKNDQGTDILLIIRNIHTFTSKYAYNINTQVFVKKQREHKHLDTVGIRHVANSLRTHGTGVLNTTINFIYQFLRQKFYLFSTFLYDEQVKSRLMKEQRVLQEAKKSKKEILYPYEQAEAFIKDIRKLGVSNNGETFIDLFRLVITQVGNAMGYIRLIQSGSKHVNYNSSLYVPNFGVDICLSDPCSLQDSTQIALRNFQANVANIDLNLSESTNFFKLLFQTFEPFFRNAFNHHLKSFFLIVPPLMLNYVEYMTAIKSKLQKKDLQDTVLFDDGFAIGLSFILKLLNQKTEFNELQWIQAVRQRMAKERQKIVNMPTNGNYDKNSTGNVLNNAMKQENEKLLQTLALSKRRINALEMENTLLYYSLNSVDVFFA